MAYLQGKFAINSLTGQWMSGNLSLHLVVFAQWSKGCLVRPGIIQRVFQKLRMSGGSTYVCLYDLQSVRQVVPTHSFALQTGAYIRLTQRTSSTNNRGVHPAVLAYVRHLRVSFGFYFLRLKSDQVISKGFKSCLSGFIKGSY